MKLTPFNSSDHFPKLLEWFNNPKIMKGMAMDLMNEEELNKWILDGKIILIGLDEGNNIVGMINFYHHKTIAPEYEVGYLIDPAFQGKGFGNTILAEGLKYVRENHPEITAIKETYVESFNDASKKILEKNGFKLDYYREDKDRYYYSLELK